VLYGMFSLVDLGYLELCLDEQLTYMHIGELPVAYSECCCVEDGCFMPLVVSMKGKEQQNF
jgi:hypothetical protein